MRKKNYNGFSLIELLIVVAVLGVLTIIVIPQYLHYLRTTKVNACISNTHTAISYIKSEVSKTTGQKIKTINILNSLNQLTKVNPMDRTMPAYIGSGTAISCQILVEELTPTFTLPKPGSTVIVHGYTKDVSGELAKIATPITVE